VIVGDAKPFEERFRFDIRVEVVFRDGVLSCQSDTTIGALWAIFVAGQESKVENLTSMQMSSTWENDTLRVLISPGDVNLTSHVPSGSNSILKIYGKAALSRIQISDYEGNLMTAVLRP
jgi:hypothetical protein